MYLAKFDKTPATVGKQTTQTMDPFRELKMLVTTTMSSMPLNQFRTTLETLSPEQRTILQSTGMTSAVISRSVGTCPFRLKIYLENGFGYNHVRALLDQAIAMDNPDILDVLLEDSVIRNSTSPLDILRTAEIRVRFHLLDSPELQIGADEFMTMVPYLTADAMRDILTHRRFWHLMRSLPNPMEWAERIIRQVCDDVDMSGYTYESIKRACKYDRYIELQSVLKEIA
jgi:hypothetical protein